MIEICNISKIYKLNRKQLKDNNAILKYKKAVDNISLSVKPGEIFGILGPNGAGKTTLLRCLTTLLIPTKGTILIDSYNVHSKPQIAREKIGFLTNDVKLDPEFTARYLFDYFGNIRKIDRTMLKLRKKYLFDYFGIEEFQDKKIRELSTGMRQKISLAISLVHDPEIIVFDEPSSGLDILTAKLVTDYLKIMKEKKKTIIISTHIMSEAEQLCDRIAMIISGKKVIEGSLADILREMDTISLEDAFFKLYVMNNEEESRH